MWAVLLLGLLATARAALVSYESLCDNAIGTAVLSSFLVVDDLTSRVNLWGLSVEDLALPDTSTHCGGRIVGLALYHLDTASTTGPTTDAAWSGVQINHVVWTWNHTVSLTKTGDGDLDPLQVFSFYCRNPAYGSSVSNLTFFEAGACFRLGIDLDLDFYVGRNATTLLLSQDAPGVGDVVVYRANATNDFARLEHQESLPDDSLAVFISVFGPAFLATLSLAEYFQANVTQTLLVLAPGIVDAFSALPPSTLEALSAAVTEVFNTSGSEIVTLGLTALTNRTPEQDVLFTQLVNDVWAVLAPKVVALALPVAVALLVLSVALVALGAAVVVLFLRKPPLVPQTLYLRSFVQGAEY